jgi:hypothetical protein
VSPKITEPLRLAAGSHKAGSGFGCVMNIISWENGDRVITDYPTCVDPTLAEMAQAINDMGCTHGAWLCHDTGKFHSSSDELITCASRVSNAGHAHLLCADCSTKVIEFGHELVGTGFPLDDLYDRYQQGWKRIAGQLGVVTVGDLSAPFAIRNRYVFEECRARPIDELLRRARVVLAAFKEEFAQELTLVKLSEMPYKFETAVSLMQTRNPGATAAEIRTSCGV